MPSMVSSIGSRWTFAPYFTSGACISHRVNGKDGEDACRCLKSRACEALKGVTELGSLHSFVAVDCTVYLDK